MTKTTKAYIKHIGTFDKNELPENWDFGYCLVGAYYKREGHEPIIAGYTLKELHEIKESFDKESV